MFLAFRPYVQRVAWAQWLPKKSATLKVVIRHFVGFSGPTTYVGWWDNVIRRRRMNLMQ